MDTPKLLLKPTRRARRTHSPDFKAQVLSECEEPGTSIAAVALRHDLNANLIHKWKNSPKVSAKTEGFVPLSLPVRSASGAFDKVTFEIEGLTIHWPLSDIDQALPWLKSLLK